MMPDKLHAIQCRQTPFGWPVSWIRIDLALDLDPDEIAAIKRTGRGKAVVVKFTPYRRAWHKLTGATPKDRHITARQIIDGRYASFDVRAEDASSVEQALRTKCRLFLQQIVDAQAAGSIRAYCLDDGKFMGGEPCG